MKHLVILHGWNQSSKYWEHAQNQLKQLPIQLHIPDLPGFGTSQLSSDELKIPDYADWVEKYIEAQIKPLHEKSVTLLGHSFGGRVAAYLATKNPQWLSHLILYAAPVLYRPTFKTKAKIMAYKVGKKISMGNKSLIKLLGQSHHTELKHADSNNLGKIYRAAINFDQTHIIPGITTPTDIIIGSHDTEVRLKIAHETNELIRNSKLHIIQGAGHNIHLDNPTLFYGLLRNLLK